MIDQLKQDRFMPVRREGLLIEAAAYPDRAETLWRGALLDSSASIRELARFHLSKSGPFDAAAFYRRALAAQPRSLAALEGLAETGDAQDLDVFRRHLRAVLPRWRRAAVRGLGATGQQQVAAELLACLRDDSPSVVRAARRQLEPMLTASANDALYAILLADGRPHLRETALRLIASTGKWSSLPWLIQASTLPDADTAALAQRLLCTWIHNTRVFTRPTDVEQRALRTAWANAEPELPDTVRTEIRHWLNSL